MSTMTITDAAQWPKHLARRVTEIIRENVKETIGKSRLVPRSTNIQLLNRRQLHTTRLLGHGRFAEVYEVLCRCDGKKRRYAMKHLRLRLRLADPFNFDLAAQQLAIEGHMLASFKHPNIIKIRGWAANGVASFKNGKYDSFFLLLDCLDETLDQRISQWESQEGNHHSPDTRKKQYLEKIHVCSQLASALEYLHGKGVIYRDIKPENVGFLNGRVKLFDFGQSREIPRGHGEGALFRMTGNIGSYPYMAPEVVFSQPYGVSADVYSWAMLCYEIVRMQKPFRNVPKDTYLDLVCKRGLRPAFDTDDDKSCLSKGLEILLDIAWEQNPAKRPSMEHIYDSMQQLEKEHRLEPRRRMWVGRTLSLPLLETLSDPDESDESFMLFNILDGPSKCTYEHSSALYFL